MLEVVGGSRKAVNAAYQAMKAAMPVSLQAVYDKLPGIEPAVAAALVRYTAREGQAILVAVAAAAPPLPAGAPAAVLAGGATVPLSGVASQTASAASLAPRSPGLAPAVRAALAAPAGGLPAGPPADSVRAGAAVKAGVKAGRPAVLPGYPVRILDGDQLAATEHRLKELGAALFGHTAPAIMQPI